MAEKQRRKGSVLGRDETPGQKADPKVKEKCKGTDKAGKKGDFTDKTCLELKGR